MKNIYEIFDEFEMSDSNEERIEIIRSNLSDTLVNVLKYTFHPDYQWYVDKLPEKYIMPDFAPGMGMTQLSTELRRIYLFLKGHPTSDGMTEKKREELLLQFLEGFEPREVEVIMGIFNKDQKVPGLTYEFVKECFPDMLP